MLHSLRVGELPWRNTKYSSKQPLHFVRFHAERAAQFGQSEPCLRVRRQRFVDFLADSLHQPRCFSLRRRKLWPTSPAGAIAGKFGIPRARKENNAISARPLRRARRPAIDASAAHGIDEAPISGGAPLLHGLPVARRCCAICPIGDAHCLGLAHVHETKIFYARNNIYPILAVKSWPIRPLFDVSWLLAALLSYRTLFVLTWLTPYRLPRHISLPGLGTAGTWGDLHGGASEATPLRQFCKRASSRSSPNPARSAPPDFSARSDSRDKCRGRPPAQPESLPQPALATHQHRRPLRSGAHHPGDKKYQLQRHLLLGAPQYRARNSH